MELDAENVRMVIIGKAKTTIEYVDPSPGVQTDAGKAGIAFNYNNIGDKIPQDNPPDTIWIYPPFMTYLYHNNTAYEAFDGISEPSFYEWWHAGLTNAYPEMPEMIPSSLRALS